MWVKRRSLGRLDGRAASKGVSYVSGWVIYATGGPAGVVV